METTHANEDLTFSNIANHVKLRLIMTKPIKDRVTLTDKKIHIER